MEIIHSFALGDRVKFVRINTKRHEQTHEDLMGKTGLITHVSYDVDSGPYPAYGFEGAAWIPHECFDFVQRATPETLQEVIRIYRKEDMEGDSDDSEESQWEDDGQDTGLIDIVRWLKDLDSGLVVSSLGNARLLLTVEEDIVPVLNEATTWNIPKGSTSHIAHGKHSKVLINVQDNDSAIIEIFDIEGNKMPETEMYYELMEEYNQTAL